MGRKKTSKQTKIYCKVVLRRKNRKKLCNPQLSCTEYFVLSTALAKSLSYTVFLKTTEHKSDSRRLFSLPKEAVWNKQKMIKCLKLCFPDGCKAV